MDTSSKPALLIRQGAILLSMPPLHAIITPDACLLFPEPGADSDIEPILSHLRRFQGGTLGVAPTGPGGVPHSGSAGSLATAAAGASGEGGDTYRSGSGSGGKHVTLVTPTLSPVPDGTPSLAASSVDPSAAATSGGPSNGTDAASAAGATGATASLLSQASDGAGLNVALGDGLTNDEPPPLPPAIKATAASSTAAAAAAPSSSSSSSSGGDGNGNGYVVGPFEYECVTTILLTANDIHDRELERLKAGADAVIRKRRRGEALAERLQ